MITIVFPNELFMEKKFTLMKTLTAFCNLLCGRKNACAVGNDVTLVSVGCTTKTVNNESNNIDDPDRLGSFLFYDQSTINDEAPSGDDSSSINDQKIKDNEDHDSHRELGMSDELAKGNGPVYDRARWRVNDDLAACNAINSEWPLVNGYFLDFGTKIMPLKEIRNLQLIFELSPYINETLKGGSLRSRLGFGWNFRRKGK